MITTAKTITLTNDQSMSMRRQEQMEVVVVGAGRLAEVSVTIVPGREVAESAGR